MDNLKVTFIQSSLYWQDAEKNRSHFQELIFQIKENSDIVVLPEMFTTGFSMDSNELYETMDGETVRWMANLAQKKDCVLTGSFIVKDSDKYYNRLVWMRPDGTFECYDKRHLFRFAGENEHFTPGNNKLIVDIKGWKICPLICFDLRFPVWSRNVNNQYDCLIYVANWPEARRKAWSTLLEARAHENQCYVVGVNRVSEDGNGIAYSGDSVVIEPKGNIISKTKPYKESVETVELNYNELQEFREKFPVVLDADQFELKV